MNAVNFSGIDNRGLLGRLARFPLRLIPASARMPVLQGPLKGRRWIAGSHTHGCWLGSYEADKQALFVREVAPGDVVFDIGANVGFYTLLASTIVGPAGKVVAFEPVPRNLRFLRDHVSINRLANATVIEAAVAETPGETTFDDTIGSAQGRISGQGRLKVRLVSVDDLVSRGELPRPTVLKIDVEGAEAGVLRGCARTIAAGKRPKIFLATHGPAVHAECLALLRSMGYQVASMNDKPVESTDEVLAV